MKSLNREELVKLFEFSKSLIETVSEKKNEKKIPTNKIEWSKEIISAYLDHSQK